MNNIFLFLFGKYGNYAIERALKEEVYFRPGVVWRSSVVETSAGSGMPLFFVFIHPQSRQSASLFLLSSELGHPYPLIRR